MGSSGGEDPGQGAAGARPGEGWRGRGRGAGATFIATPTLGHKWKVSYHWEWTYVSFVASQCWRRPEVLT